jgi:hypothetical protein
MVCAYEQVKDAFYGHLVNKSIFAHQSIDWDYLDKYASTCPLKAKFQHIVLLKFTQFTCDWNETIIRQFSATMEVDWEDGSVT